jgi:putative endonuclease
VGQDAHPTRIGPKGTPSHWRYNGRVTECYCYILECADGSFYTGWTTDPERRLKEHNAGRGARYTRSRRPLKLVYLEPQSDRSTAMRRERAIKSRSRQAKLKLIRSQTQPPPISGKEASHV